jgi:hypothetical protein
MVFHHWGASKLERAFKIEIVSLTWHDMDAKKYFGSSLWPLMDGTKMH